MKEPICAGPCPDISAGDITLPARTARPSGIIKAILQWLERRRQQRHMDRLSNHMLRDIGLSRADVDSGFRKQSWHR